jgi:hypothetical protein
MARGKAQGWQDAMSLMATWRQPAMSFVPMP